MKPSKLLIHRVQQHRQADGNCGGGIPVTSRSSQISRSLSSDRRLSATNNPRQMDKVAAVHVRDYARSVARTKLVVEDSYLAVTLNIVEHC